MNSNTPELDALLGTRDVCRITGRSRSSIFRDIELDRFPRPLKIGPKSNAWLQSEIAAWMSALPRRRTLGED